MIAYCEEFQYLMIHTAEVAAALHRGDRAMLAMPAKPLTEQQDGEYLQRLVWLRMRICQPYTLSDKFRLFEKL